MVFVLVLSILLNAVSVYAVLRALRRTETYDDFFEQMQSTLSATINTMTTIDIRGSFQADDEVGDTFKQLKGMVDALDVFIVTNRDAK